MTRTITTMFYDHGGYVSDSGMEEQDNYISLDDVTSTYVPQAVLRLNSLCNATVSVDYTSLSSGNIMDDVIIAELALSIADSEYDKLHVDPETFEVENKHWQTAYRYMLDMYGLVVDGKSKLPREALSTSPTDLAYGDLGIATMSL